MGNRDILGNGDIGVNGDIGGNGNIWGSGNIWGKWRHLWEWRHLGNGDMGKRGMIVVYGQTVAHWVTGKPKGMCVSRRQS